MKTECIVCSGTFHSDCVKVSDEDMALDSWACTDCSVKKTLLTEPVCGMMAISRSLLTIWHQTNIDIEKFAERQKLQDVLLASLAQVSDEDPSISVRAALHCIITQCAAAACTRLLCGTVGQRACWSHEQ